MNSIALLGSILGQLIFGYLADKYGRRKVYGLEVIITIVGIAGLIGKFDGFEWPMSVLAWMSFWRFLVGIGIGADYPLSAVISAE